MTTIEKMKQEFRLRLGEITRRHYAPAPMMIPVPRHGSLIDPATLDLARRILAFHARAGQDAAVLSHFVQDPDAFDPSSGAGGYGSRRTFNDLVTELRSLKTA